VLAEPRGKTRRFSDPPALSTTFRAAMAAGTPPAWSFSLVDCKQLYLIRHGQGHHNTAARDRGRAAYKDPALLDAR